jgi:hypothetical protein
LITLRGNIGIHYYKPQPAKDNCDTAPSINADRPLKSYYYLNSLVVANGELSCCSSHLVDTEGQIACK